jgi:amidophosphoribosyltransferase
MDERTVYAARDPHGVRPLGLGRLPGGGWCVASETAAFDVVGASHVREIEPGELVAIDDRGVRSFRFAESPRPALCLFEFVYLGRADSRMYGRTLHEARKEAGRRLAAEAPVDADMVMPIPDTAVSAAQGYADVAGIPYGEGLIKNRYIGRTFIEPTPALRQRGVKLKLNPLPEAIAGKRLIVVDDSIVRGTTTRQLVQVLREAGALEVHLRITSPPIRWPCFYGIDMSTRGELIAASRDTEEVREFVGADSLAHASLDAVIAATEAPKSALCRACFDGEYPIPVGEQEPSKFVLEKS